ncbi:MAG: tripartite tricarboxylate transporter substrate binding protein [Proteobacteria bacterium]|nr:tripartite tricarboxylate transporter substrate binding protein [Pseudomonadota bacterium]
MQRRWMLAAAAAVLAACALPASAADPYPNRPVTITVPFAPGGPGDLTARFIAQGLQKELGQNFVIENKPGANGVLAAGVVAHAAPDGYNLLQISSSHTANESLIPNRGYNLMKDFDPVASLNFTEMVLMVNNELPVKTVPELIAYLKANPGKVNFGSGGNGSAYHLAAELFKSMTGTQMTHVPYKSSANARSDLIGGQIQVMFDALPSSLELIRAGKMRALATTARTRSSVLDVPTVAETVPGYESTIFVGLMAPKGTPPAVLDKLHDAINKVLSTPESTAYWAKQGARPMIMSREEYRQYLEHDITETAKIVKISGAKID